MPRARARTLAIFVAISIGLAAGPAATAFAASSGPKAPSAAEQRAFAEGRRLFDAGDARGAARAWQAGYAAGHDPAFLVPIGEALEKAGDPPHAIESYERYLRESPDAADRAEIEARVRRLAPRDATPSPKLDFPDEAAPEPAPAPTPTPMPTNPAPSGTTPDATASGAPLPQQQAAPAPAPDAAATPAAGSAPRPPAARQARDDSDDLRAVVDTNPSERSTLNIAGWIGAGVTVVALGTAAFFGASASSKESDVNRLLTYRDKDTDVPLEYAQVAAEYESAVADGKRYDRLAKGFLIGAACGAAVTTTLFIIDAYRTPEPQPSAGLGYRDVLAVPQARRAPARPRRPALFLGTRSFGLGWAF